MHPTPLLQPRLLVCFSLALPALLVGLTPPLRGQDYKFRVAAPVQVTGPVGSRVVYEAAVEIHRLDGTSIDDVTGWSVGIAVDGNTPAVARITACTTERTAGAPKSGGGFRSDGFERTLLATNGNLSGCLSTVALGATESTSLPPVPSACVLRVTLESTVPSTSTVVCISCTDGLRSGGLLINNVVSHLDLSASPPVVLRLAPIPGQALTRIAPGAPNVPPPLRFVRVRRTFDPSVHPLGAVVRVALVATGVSSPTTITETLDPRLTVVDPGGGVVAGSQITFTVGMDAALSYTVRTPNDPGNCDAKNFRGVVRPTGGCVSQVSGHCRLICCPREFDAQEVLRGAFVFGVQPTLCANRNDPAGRNYAVVAHTSPAALEYTAARGWGYVVTNPGNTTRGGYGRFGPFDDSPNDRGVFTGGCGEVLYDSFIGAKDFAMACNEALVGNRDDPCAPTIPAQGIVFRANVPNGTYRFVAAAGDPSNPHAHRIVVEDGGAGPAGTLRSNHVVLVRNFDQNQAWEGETRPDCLGCGVYARVGFNGKLPPVPDGAAPDPMFVDMDEGGRPTRRCPESPTLVVTQGYVRVHQLQANANVGPGSLDSGTRVDANGGDLTVLELWQVDNPATLRFELGFSPSCGGQREGNAGEVVTGNLDCRLTPLDNATGLGAQAWAISLGAEGLRIADITTEGTVGAEAAAGPPGLRVNGFERSEITAGPGNEGAVSVVVLSFDQRVTLPPSDPVTIARIAAEGMFPAAGTCTPTRVFYADGRRGSAQPVANTVTVDGRSTPRSLGDCGFELCARGGGTFSRGNANADANVDISDGVFILGFLFLGTAMPSCLDAADTNDSGIVDLSDAIRVLGFLFLGNAPPPPPFPGCGVDPTPDGLDCGAFPACP